MFSDEKMALGQMQKELVQRKEKEQQPKEKMQLAINSYNTKIDKLRGELRQQEVVDTEKGREYEQLVDENKSLSHKIDTSLAFINNTKQIYVDFQQKLDVVQPTFLTNRDNFKIAIEKLTDELEIKSQLVAEAAAANLRIEQKYSEEINEKETSLAQYQKEGEILNEQVREMNDVLASKAQSLDKVRQMGEDALKALQDETNLLNVEVETRSARNRQEEDAHAAFKVQTQQNIDDVLEKTASQRTQIAEIEARCATFNNDIEQMKENRIYYDDINIKLDEIIKTANAMFEENALKIRKLEEEVLSLNQSQKEVDAELNTGSKQLNALQDELELHNGFNTSNQLDLSGDIEKSQAVLATLTDRVNTFSMSEANTELKTSCLNEINTLTNEIQCWEEKIKQEQEMQTQLDAEMCAELQTQQTACDLKNAESVQLKAQVKRMFEECTKLQRRLRAMPRRSSSNCLPILQISDISTSQSTIASPTNKKKP